MAAVTTLLRELHRLRKHLRELQSEIDLGPRVLKLREKTLADEEQAHKDAYETIKRLKLKQKEDEVSLRTAEMNLAKYQAHLNSAASKKEFDAKTTEIATATAQKSELEDAILTTIADIEDRTKKLPEVEARWAAAKKDFEEYKVEAKERLERLIADQKASQEALKKAEVGLPVELKGLYDRLVKAHGPDGLAGVAGRCCRQCQSTLTEQQRTTLLSGSHLICPSCGRMLYLDD